MGFPTNGEASTYSDYFVGRRTANGEIYSHEDYTAALLPKSRWYLLPLGTCLKLSCKGLKVVVKVNDRGAGKIINGIADERRVLDLSRAAMAYLSGKSVTDSNAGMINLDNICIMSANTPLVPVN